MTPSVPWSRAKPGDAKEDDYHPNEARQTLDVASSRCERRSLGSTDRASKSTRCREFGHPGSIGPPKGGERPLQPSRPAMQVVSIARCDSNAVGNNRFGGDAGARDFLKNNEAIFLLKSKLSKCADPEGSGSSTVGAAALRRRLARIRIRPEDDMAWCSLLIFLLCRKEFVKFGSVKWSFSFIKEQPPASQKKGKKRPQTQTHTCR
jgi:hypothetical protein